MMEGDEEDLTQLGNFCTVVTGDCDNSFALEADVTEESPSIDDTVQPDMATLLTPGCSNTVSHTITLPSTTVILPKNSKSSQRRYSNVDLPKVITLAPPARKMKSVNSKTSTSSATHFPAPMITLVDTSKQSKHPAKISMKGRPVVVDGEIGVFIPNSLMQKNDIDFTVHSQSTEDTCNSSSQKWQRTVGVSTAHEVPTEIGPLFYKSSHLIGGNGLRTSSAVSHSIDRVSTSEHCTQTTDDDFYDFNSFRETYLPQSDKYTYNYTARDGSDLVEFRIAGPTCKETVGEWVRELEAICNVHYRVWKTYKVKKDGAYKVDLRCHMNQGKNHKTMKGKDFGCRGMLSIKVDPSRLSKGVANRTIRERFRCRVRFRYTHNHTEEESLKHMSVSKDVRDKIVDLFTQGMSIADAYTKHYQDLKTEYGAKYYEIVCNRSLCPDKGYFYNVWKRFCLNKYGKVMKPPKSAVPKVPWNKGLKGVTSLKEFFPPEEQGLNARKRKGEPSKRERIRRAALEAIDTSLMESIRQNPEVYSRAVSCFVEVWRSMDDRDRLAWLQTKVEDNSAQRVMLVTTDQLDETIQAAENINFIQFAEQHSYSDVVIGDNEQEVEFEPSSRKHLKLDEHSSAEPISQFSFCHFAEENL